MIFVWVYYYWYYTAAKLREGDFDLSVIRRLSDKRKGKWITNIFVDWQYKKQMKSVACHLNKVKEKIFILFATGYVPFKKQSSTEYLHVMLVNKKAVIVFKCKNDGQIVGIWKLNAPRLLSKTNRFCLTSFQCLLLRY